MVMYPMLLVYMDRPFWTAPSVFSIVYVHGLWMLFT